MSDNANIKLYRTVMRWIRSVVYCLEHCAKPIGVGKWVYMEECLQWLRSIVIALTKLTV